MTTQGGMSADVRAVVNAIAEPAHPGVLVIKANNSPKRTGTPGGKGWIALSKAIAADACFAVQTRKIHVVFDFDVKGRNPSLVHAQVEDLENMAANCRVPCVVVESGSGWHVYLTIGNVTDVLRTRLKVAGKASFDAVDEVRIGGKGSLIRPIGVRHRALKDEFGQPLRARPVGLTLDEVLSRLTDHPRAEAVEVLVEGLELCAPADGPGSTVRLMLPRKAGLDRGVLEALAGGMPPIGTRSSVSLWVACDAVTSGYSFEEYRELVRGTWIEPYHEKKQPWGLEERLLKEYTSAIKKVHQRQARAEGGGDDEVRAGAKMARQALLGSPGPGGRWWSAGGHALFDALLEMVEVFGRTGFTCSVRQAALASGLGRSAVQRDLCHFEAAGLLTIHRAEKRSKASTLEVHLDRLPTLLGLTVDGLPGDAGLDSAAGSGRCQGESELMGELALCPTSRILLSKRGQDVWTSKGLGPAAWRVYAASATETCHAASLGHSERRHQQQTRRLVRHGLLHPETLLAVADDEALLAAAADLDATGTVHLRRLRYADERERVAEDLERIGVLDLSNQHQDNDAMVAPVATSLAA